MYYLSAAIETGSAVAATSGGKGNPLYYIPISIVLLIMMCSPAIQITLSTKKNKYMGLIFPAATFVVFGAIMLIIHASLIITLVMTFGMSLALIVFHVIVRRNMRF